MNASGFLKDIGQANLGLYLAGLSALKLKDASLAKSYFEAVLDNSRDFTLTEEAAIGLDHISGRNGSAGEPSSFAVQIGSFKKKGNADRLYRNFKRRKYTVRVIKEKSGRATVYKVKIGAFKRESDASRFAKRLNRQGYETAVVAY